ncbi:hypothetical protein Tco_1202722 [Tanacetum coccineum]
MNKNQFSNGTLDDVWSALNDIAKGIRMEYLSMRKWSNLDKKRARVMVQDIDKQLYQRWLMRNLKKFIEHQSDTKVIHNDDGNHSRANIKQALDAEYDESNTYVLERFNTTAGNPVKDILLKLNLPDHRSILTDSKEYIKMDMEVIDCFKEALDRDKDPMERSFDDYKWVFDLEIEQLADEYEFGIRKKGHILDMIWENCKNIQGKSKEWWYDYWLEEDEKQENGDKKYDPPMVHMETFKITRYLFNNRNSFICVIDEIKDTLSLRTT